MSPKKTETPDAGDELPLAAEFVLGLVQGAERDVLEKRRRDDYQFASEVEFWETRLGPLADAALSADVPAYIWQRIAKEVGHEPVPLAASSAVERRGLWNSLGFWRALGIASLALAAACIVLFLSGPVSPPPALVATLSMDDGRSAYMATVDRMTGKVMLMPAADMKAPPERTYELWIVPPDGKPVSLGTLKAAGAVTIDMPSAVMPHAGTQSALVISVEPMGGSPTGEPTGPVVAKGMMQDI
jgi:anti-sigma-K factor RskA